MKLINTDIDSLFLSGKIMPLVSKERKELKEIGLTINLGDVIDSTLPNRFTLTTNEDDVTQLVHVDLTKAEFTIRDDISKPTLVYTKKKRRDSFALLLTGTAWTNMANQPLVEGVLLKRPEDIHSISLLASGVSETTDSNKIQNSLLKIPCDAYYVLDGEVYRLDNDKTMPKKPKGSYVSISDILANCTQ